MKLNWDKINAIAIGGSAGSFDIVCNIISKLPNKLPCPIFITTHVAASSSGYMADHYSSLTNNIKIYSAKDKAVIEKNAIYVAIPDYHLGVSIDKRIELIMDEQVHYTRPSIDVMFKCLTDAYDKNILAVLLTGANQDGANGLKEIKDIGGYTIVQDPKTASNPQMPQSAIDINAHCEILSIEEIITLFENV